MAKHIVPTMFAPHCAAGPRREGWISSCCGAESLTTDHQLGHRVRTQLFTTSPNGSETRVQNKYVPLRVIAPILMSSDSDSWSTLDSHSDCSAEFGLCVLFDIGYFPGHAGNPHSRIWAKVVGLIRLACTELLKLSDACSQLRAIRHFGRRRAFWDIGHGINEHKWTMGGYLFNNTHFVQISAISIL